MQLRRFNRERSDSHLALGAPASLPAPPSMECGGKRIEQQLAQRHAALVSPTRPDTLIQLLRADQSTRPDAPTQLLRAGPRRQIQSGVAGCASATAVQKPKKTYD